MCLILFIQSVIVFCCFEALNIKFLSFVTSLNVLRIWYYTFDQINSIKYNQLNWIGSNPSNQIDSIWLQKWISVSVSGFRESDCFDKYRMYWNCFVITKFNLAIFGPIWTQFRSKQLKICPQIHFWSLHIDSIESTWSNRLDRIDSIALTRWNRPVSYTHLTLPTNREV